MQQSPRIAIIGAGPIGLEAALAGVRGGFDVAVYERASVAANIRSWGHVKLFSPFGMNSSSEGRAVVQAMPGAGELPGDDELLTGEEFATRYLLPLSRAPELAGCIREHTWVCGVSRAAASKGHLIGDLRRQASPFQLLLRTEHTERYAFAEYVLDCSGTYPHHNWIGAGGLPALGEFACREAIDYCLPDITGCDRPQFEARRTLVVGSGYSAATAVVALGELAEGAPETRVVWVTRPGLSEPVVRFPDDPLGARDQLAGRANRLASREDGPVQWLPGWNILSLARDEDTGRLLVTLENGHAVSRLQEPEDESSEDRPTRKTLEVDRVIANVGFRPDNRVYQELQVHECYATQGPIRLAAALLGESGGDCLSAPVPGRETLITPEPDFFLLGVRSYGRNSRFLLRTGLQQVRDVFELIGEARKS